MLAHQREETLVMGRFDQVKHLVDHHVLEQILGLLHKFGVQANVPRPVIVDHFADSA